MTTAESAAASPGVRSASHTEAGTRAQVRRASNAFETLIDEYARDSCPIEVSFRSLVGPIPVDDLSHSAYPYPARLLRQIPRFFLNCEQLAAEGSTVLDPFCGSGTVLVEALASRVHSWGIDSNPLARLLARVKTTPLDTETSAQALASVLRAAKSHRSAPLPEVINIDLWFTPAAQSVLARIRRAIDESEVAPVARDFLLLCLALTADRASLRDPRVPVPVRRRDWSDHRAGQTMSDVWRLFEVAGAAIGPKLAAIPKPPGITAVVEGTDARVAQSIYAGMNGRIPRPGLILTSPPYGAAQKYVRSSSLAMCWTGLASSGDLAQLERISIGREHLRDSEATDLDVRLESIAAEVQRISSVNQRRAAVYADYFRSMDGALAGLVDLLEDGGHLVLIAGSNVVSDKVVDTHQHLRDLALTWGLSPILELRDAIRGRTLMTKRASKSVPLQFESVHVLQKVGHADSR
jgi:hypothetical protein